jgi:predicted porin
LKTALKNNFKKQAFAAAALGVLATPAAFAQSSVTLYGLIDSGIAYVNHSSGSASQVKFSSGNTYGSRWGIKGAEDIGGGTKTVFQLEDGFNLGTGAFGQGGREFGRKAVVGLSNDKYGAVTIGRQYDPIVDVVQPLTEDNYFGGTFATPGDADNYDNSVRVSNSVKYVSPLFNGLQAEALWGVGGVAGATSSQQTLGFGLSYANGPLGLAAGYYYADGGGVTANGLRTFTSSSDSIFNTAINNGFATARTVQIARAAATYAFGNALAGLSYSNVAYRADALSTFTQTAKLNVGGVFFNYRVTSPLLLGVGYNYTRLNGPASANYNQFNAGLDYALSKRTSLYALAAFQKANGTTLSSTGTLTAATASIGSYGVNSGGSKQALAIVGIRERF